MARLVAIWYSSLVEVRLGDAERVAAIADEMRTLVDEFALAHGRTACRWFRGWADARTGNPRDGYRRIREAYEDNVRLGMVVGASETLGYAAEALLLAGDFDEAAVQLQEALRIADDVSERVYLPQLLLVDAGIARARGDRTASDTAIRRALAEAKAQQAPWLILIALTELCEHRGANAQDRKALARLVDQMPEAADTNAVARARTLLAR